MADTYKNVRKAIRAEIRENSALVACVQHFKENNAVFFPGYGNLGDGLIALGTLDFFKDMEWAPSCIYGHHKEAFLGHSHVVLGGGGGWVKGLWFHYSEQAVAFLQGGGQLLILPTSFAGLGAELVPYAEQVTIFCRERQSYEELLRLGMPESRIFLCPDMAFYTKEEHFSGLEEEGQYPVLQILRRDEEGIRKNHPRDSVDLPLLFNDVQWAEEAQCLGPLRAVAGLINQFECVETDRLHMAVLAALIGRTVRLEPSSYFKIKAIFDYTLHRFPKVSFHDRLPEAGSAGHGEASEVRQLQETIKKLNLERQEEWERLTAVLQQNDSLLADKGNLQDQVQNLSEQEASERRQKEEFAEHVRSLEHEMADLKNEALHLQRGEVGLKNDILNLKHEAVRLEDEKLRLKQAMVQMENEQFRLKHEMADLRLAVADLEKIRSSRLHRLGEWYYGIFRVPVFGFFLRILRRVFVR